MVIGSGGGGGRVVQVPDDLVSDDLWERVAPLLPPRPLRRRRYPGRLPVDDRAALRGIVYVLRTGVTWTDVPTETIGCSRVTCWRRLRDWTKAGVWPRRHEILLAERRRAGLLDMEDAVVDASHVRALKGGSHRTGEQRGRTVEATRPDETAPQPFAQISARTGHEHAQLPEREREFDPRHPRLSKPQVGDLGLLLHQSLGGDPDTRRRPCTPECGVMEGLGTGRSRQERQRRSCASVRPHARLGGRQSTETEAMKASILRFTSSAWSI
ncbi:hypothetical protein GCM10010240_54800 [Streptomyces griseoviridis]|nr:hypothetical protein GCM10010240_54800 [Streptomyces griseoviridis]